MKAKVKLYGWGVVFAIILISITERVLKEVLGAKINGLSLE
jgi:hypothetical protein